jgi:thiol-disulfide isomerase/thioredoxin
MAARVHIPPRLFPAGVAQPSGMRHDCAITDGNQPRSATMQRLDQFTFYPVLADTPGPALVFFSAASCGSCRHWKRVLDEYAAAAGALPVYEVDAGLDQALAREFELFHLPALFLFVDGEFHRPLQCAAAVASLCAAIDAALAMPAQEAP